MIKVELINLKDLRNDQKRKSHKILLVLNKKKKRKILIGCLQWKKIYVL